MQLPINWNLTFVTAALLGAGFASWNTAATRARWLGERELQSRLVEIEQGIASTRYLLEDNLKTVREASVVQPRLADPSASAQARQAVRPDFELDMEQLDALSEKIDQLELLFASTDHRGGAERVPETVEDVMASEMAHQSMLEYQHLFTDPGADWSQRIDSLRMLRRFPAEKEAMSGRVVDSALDLFRNAENPEQVAQVIDAIDGTTDPRLAGEYMRLIQGSSDERVRAESVGALESFVDDPEVRAYLTQLADHDSSRKVRKVAERALD